MRVVPGPLIDFEGEHIKVGGRYYMCPGLWCLYSDQASLRLSLKHHAPMAQYNFELDMNSYEIIV
jgi:hypothetical protein